VSKHYKNTIKRVAPVQWGPHHHSTEKWTCSHHSWNIAELALNNNHSFTHLT